MKKYSIIIFLVGLTGSLYSQIGGKHAYEFLNLPSSSRITALGGVLPSVMDDDISLAYSNPASLNSKMDNQLLFSQNFHFSGINNGYVAYGKTVDKWGVNLHAGVQYISYGEFDKADILGIKDGTFSGGEEAFVLGASKKLASRISVGANLKGVFSHFDTYNSTGLLADVGMNYFNDSTDFVFSLVVRNIGAELTTYSGTRFGTPLDVSIGISKRLAHLPFRLSITAFQLQTGNIRYDDPANRQTTDIFGGEIKEKPFKKSVDNVFRHIVIGGEFLLGKNENFRLRAGYNHLRRQELSLGSFRSLAGFSFGFGVKITGFRLDYGVGYHHLAGAVNNLTISTDMGRFFKKV